MFERLPSNWMLAIKSIGYWFWLIPVLGIPLSYYWSQDSDYANAWAWMVICVVFGVIPLLDFVVGRDPANPDERVEVPAMERQGYYRLLSLASVPLLLGMLAWAGLLAIAGDAQVDDSGDVGSTTPGILIFLLVVVAWVVGMQVGHVPWWCSALTAGVLVWRAVLALTSTSVQAGALRDRLATLGYPAEVLPKDGKFEVRINRFATEQDARAVVERLGALPDLQLKEVRVALAAQ